MGNIFNEDFRDFFLIKTIHKDDLISAKKAAGRPKDLDDLQNL